MSAAQVGTGVSVFVVDPDGRAARVVVARGADGWCAEALRSVLRCRLFDVVRLSADRLDMWVDDEGLTVPDPVVNSVATRIAGFYGLTRQLCAGRVVFASHDGSGDTASLSDAQVGWLASMVSEWGGAVVPADRHPASTGEGVSA